MGHWIRCLLKLSALFFCVCVSKKQRNIHFVIVILLLLIIIYSNWTALFLSFRVLIFVCGTTGYKIHDKWSALYWVVPYFVGDWSQNKLSSHKRCSEGERDYSHTHNQSTCLIVERELILSECLIHWMNKLMLKAKCRRYEYEKKWHHNVGWRRNGAKKMWNRTVYFFPAASVLCLCVSTQQDIRIPQNNTQSALFFYWNEFLMKHKLFFCNKQQLLKWVIKRTFPWTWTTIIKIQILNQVIHFQKETKSFHFVEYFLLYPVTTTAATTAAVAEQLSLSEKLEFNKWIRKAKQSEKEGDIKKALKCYIHAQRIFPQHLKLQKKIKFLQFTIINSNVWIFNSSLSFFIISNEYIIIR